MMTRRSIAGITPPDTSEFRPRTTLPARVLPPDFTPLPATNVAMYGASGKLAGSVAGGEIGVFLARQSPSA